MCWTWTAIRIGINSTEQNYPKNIYRQRQFADTLESVHIATSQPKDNEKNDCIASKRTSEQTNSD